MKISSILPAIFGLFLAIPALAGPAALLKDIHPGYGSGGSSPTELTVAGDHLYFWSGAGLSRISAATGESSLITASPAGNSLPAAAGSRLYFFNSILGGSQGTELHTSDGTPSGTIFKTSFSTFNGTGYVSGIPHRLAGLGGSAYYCIQSQVSGSSSWLMRADGVSGETWPIYYPFSGASGTMVISSAVAGGKLFFTSHTGNGCVIFRTDGTSSGNSLVKSIPLIDGSGSVSPQTLAVLGNNVFFHAKNSTNGDELWKSDGTDAGTVMVADIRPGTAGSMSSLPSAAALGAHVYFAANNGVNGTELWRTDGTPAGTTMVKDIHSGAGSSSPASFITVGGTLYFSATTTANGRELWRSDGTDLGTVMITDLAAGAASGISASPAMLGYGGNLYFSANNVTNGEELWRTDGTLAGTQMVGDLRAGSASSAPASLVEFDGMLHFTADNGVLGREIWKTDGVSPPEVIDLSGENSGSPGILQPMAGGFSLLAATDADGRELWRTDGSGPETIKVKDIAPGTASSSPDRFQPVGNKMFFRASTPTAGAEPWVSDGTETGTLQLADIAAGTSSSNPSVLTMLGNNLLFTSTGGLYRTDGTPAGTLQLLSSSGTGGVVIGSTFYFTGNDGVNGAELWKTDGSLGGTMMVKDIQPGSGGSSPGLFVAHDGKLFFRAADSGSDSELWKSDGTAAGTVKVKDIYPGTTGSAIEKFHSLGTVLYFTANSPSGRELWKTDGSEAGTAMVADLTPGTGSTNFGATSTAFFTINGRVIFYASNSIYGAEYWTTDGTSAGTMPLKDIRPGSSGSSPNYRMVLPDAFYFEADDGTHGKELWRSDGTEAGTYMVKNIMDDTSSGTVQPVFAAGGYVYIQALGVINGIVTNGRHRLWRTDGTEAGTEPVINLETGATFLSGGVINQSRVVGNDVYFVATTTESERGTELWLIEPDAPHTRPVSDIHSGPGGSNGSFLGEEGGLELLSAYSPGIGQELHTIDPTAVHPPFATTRAASAVGSTSATLQGLVFADGQAMTAAFEYGTTLELGTSVPLALSPPDDAEPQTVSHTLTDLAPGMTYFYRLSGANAVATDSGGIRSFRTIATNASLASLTAGSAVLSPAFQPGVLNYQVTLSAATSAVTVAAESLDALATVSVAGSPFGTRFRNAAVTTNPGTTHVSVNVVAQDGVSSLTYTLTITRPPAPEISVSGGGTNIVDGDSSPSTIDRTEHGLVELGSSGLFLFTVSNAGTEPLTIQAPVISGTHADDFTVISAPGPTIAPGISSLLLVTFTPSALGTRSAAISFANNDGDENPFNFSIRGTGIVPQVPEIVMEHPAGTVLDTNPAAIDFGSTAVAATGATREIIIRNTGTSPLQDIYTGISGLAENDFILDAGTLGTSLAPGSMATITVTFNPTKGGRRDAVLEITSNDADENPFLINLSGVGVKSYDFTYSQNALNVDANGTLVLSSPAVANSPFEIAENSQTILPQFQSYNFINTCSFGNYPYSFSRNGATTVNGIARTGNLNQPISFTLCAGTFNIGASQPVSWTLDAGGGDIKTLGLVIGAGTGGWMPGTFTLSEVNDPPVAVITDPPATIPLGTTLTLDGSASYDLDGSGHIAAWNWDLDNDGIYERSGPMIEVQGEQFPATWIANTPAPIRLRVTDNSGSTNVQLITPSILPEPVPAFQLLAPTDVRVTRATLNATINPNGYASWAYIDWGTNSNYGSTLFLTLDPADGAVPQSVSGVLEYLTASTTYYFRLVVGNDYGAFYSEEANFTTPSPAGLLGSTVAAVGLSGDDALPGATPFNDGVENLLKYAFNMNLAGPDAKTIAAGGTAGLPAIGQSGTGAAGVLRFEFVRRIGSGLVYSPKKSTSLDPAGWTTLTDAPTITPIGTDGLWERVIYEEPSDPAVVPTCFGRVDVTVP